MTFTSMSGTAVWNPSQQDKIYGDIFKLPQKNQYLFIHNKI